MNATVSLALSLLLAALFAAPPTFATPWPQLSNPRISSCVDNTQLKLKCASMVFYAHDGTTMIDMNGVGRPDPSLSLELAAYGIHCARGDGPTKQRFTGCDWGSSTDRVHSPATMGPCTLKSYDSWELMDGMTCATSTAWGRHNGAGAGGECVVFAQVGGQDGAAALLTNTGMLDATTAANGGSVFCQKMLPPNTICDVDLPQVIDHGVVAPNSSSVVGINGLVDCGSNPSVSIMGGETLQVGPGVVSRLTHTIVGGRYLSIKSNLTAANSTGVHQTSFIVVVSPY
ncbi:hypothetical protein L580_2049 [Serratia fonticola AU-P3(3)]|nr:hypothetical protein L580_2049 [Serratia fonticola AU-P3(3)]